MQDATMQNATNDDIYKLQAAKAAMSELKSGMRLGLGTGSTAKHFVDLLGTRVAQGFECICVATSEQTARQARALNIVLSDLDATPKLDLTIDGTDEIDPALNLIKGGGGALLREKIVAAASRRMVVIAGHSKLVKTLGAFPLPIEVNPFGFRASWLAIEAILQNFAPDQDFTLDNGAKLVSLRQALSLRQDDNGQTFVTDGGHYIIDACFGRILDAKALSASLLDVPGIVQHGLFLNLCHGAYIAGPDGVTKLGA